MTKREAAAPGWSKVPSRGGIAALALALASAAGCGGSDGSSDAPSPVVQPTPAPALGASTISFSPSVVFLDNPTSQGGSTEKAVFEVEVRALDAQGDVIEPSPENPLYVEVHGAPEGAITPAVATVTSGSTLTFTYDGSYFPNPVTLTAWIEPVAEAASASLGAASSTAGSTSLGRTQMLQANPIDCEYGTGSYALAIPCESESDPASCASEALEKGLRVQAAIGYDDPSGHLATFAVDTGSLGVVVPVSELGPNAVGPGAAGKISYDSSGNTYAGHYYMAPVSFALTDGSVITTAPIQVLGIDTAYCEKGYPKCEEHPPSPNLHYLGVGFDRNSTEPGDEFDSPADNAFLQAAVAGGSSVSPGYVLGTTSITLGITSTEGYGLDALTPNATYAGDWNAAQGCFGFPELPEPNQFCGSLLLDVGITEMFLDLEPSQRPAGAVEPPSCSGDGGATHESCLVPDETVMQILAGSATAPAMSYQFTVSPEPTGPAPKFVRWIDDPNVFVNTGRRPLAQFDYLYDARCGNVGFKPAG